MAGALEGDLFIGPKAKEHRGLLNIKYPIEHGIVTDWNDMEQIWTVIRNCNCSIINIVHSLKLYFVVYLL